MNQTPSFDPLCAKKSVYSTQKTSCRILCQNSLKNAKLFKLPTQVLVACRKCNGRIGPLVSSIITARSKGSIQFCTLQRKSNKTIIAGNWPPFAQLGLEPVRLIKRLYVGSLIFLVISTYFDASSIMSEWAIACFGCSIFSQQSFFWDGEIICSAMEHVWANVHIQSIRYFTDMRERCMS